MKAFIKENWPPVIGAVLASAALILVQTNACAPFALIGSVSYKGKDLVVCDSVDGPIVREIK